MIWISSGKSPHLNLALQIILGYFYSYACSPCTWKPLYALSSRFGPLASERTPYCLVLVNGPRLLLAFVRTLPDLSQSKTTPLHRCFVPANYNFHDKIALNDAKFFLTLWIFSLANPGDRLMSYRSVFVTIRLFLCQYIRGVGIPVTEQSMERTWCLQKDWSKIIKRCI